ncbi:SidA/IucD/PvdA family monooxygenase [Marinomonas transparens]|uniref:Lysine N(6)-hydroxylase/L-ornithine N(5)-oxygenase family protein n=1 Tax=Marinomonas transparens TaxID=2795388 RepID=A0A934N1E0_9GAMM|nr:SidA/IucD/PvdA family monooxygenase [Marinomonas transparens]MBJ7536588.1 lysine N(6)-hydroxylase/L-ornithine N(5)-oxygenase family protein [Marinomonas transparens]
MKDSNAPEIFDLIGVGCGPSNLALAIALDEQEQNLNTVFLEKQVDYSWHGNTITGNSYLQISFLKDLVSFRNPMSYYSFINYLKVHNRLHDFTNLGTFYPSRLEFNDYIRWVAKQFSHQCQYDAEVIAIEPIKTGDTVTSLNVLSRDHDGKETSRITRSLVVGTGGKPYIPEPFKTLKTDSRVFHHSTYLKSVKLKTCNTEKRVSIVGGGQSAAEAFLDIYENDPSIKIDLIVRGSSLKPSDSSPFVNEIFAPKATDAMFNMTDHHRAETLKEYHHTNYAAIDLPMIEQIYSILYKQKITGDIRHRLLLNTSVEASSAQENGISLNIINSSNGSSESNVYDQVILATGYERNAHRELLSSLSDYTKDFEADRDYRLLSDPRLQTPIYLQGYCEHSHGISDTLLSILATRSGEITTSLYNALNSTNK